MKRPSRSGLLFAACLAATLGAACGGDHSPAPSSAPASSHPLTGPETACATCHPQHVADWTKSSHAYAMHDPVFQAMVSVGQHDTKGELGDFCVKCHSPIGVATGETKVQKSASGDFVQPLTGLTTEAADGVSCLVCHSITQVNTNANADFVMVRNGVRHGPISDPDPTPSHRSAYSDLHEKSSVCGTCHVVVNPNNVALERTHIEWMQSVFNDGTRSCQFCHMRERKGPAAVGHKERTVHDHKFVGVDVSLLPEADFPGYDEQRASAVELLQSSVTLAASADAASRAVAIDIVNLAGHALPSGATSDRQMWVEMLVTDDAGKVVMESGTLDELGDLRVSDPERTTQPGTDPGLVLYSQEMVFDPKIADPTSTEAPRTVDFLWEPNSDVTHIIQTQGADHRTYDLSALPAGHYTVSFRLLFRSFPPHLLRKLEKLARLDPKVKDRVPTVEMATAQVDVSLQ
jgi:hypothetical protein